RGVLMATLDLGPPDTGSSGSPEALFEELLKRIEQRRDVQATGVVSFPPLTPTFSLTSFEIVGQPRARTMAVPQLASSGYLRALRWQLVSGRWLTREDEEVAAPVVVVNEAFVRRYVQGGSAIGRELKLGQASFTIAGVVSDAHLLGLAVEPKPE